MAKLKVYRTPIGFHDAYVAAPSQKAALEAWGSDADLFARGIAEIVTDEVLSVEPLASPGNVIRKLRGTADEQLEAARMPDRPKVGRSEESVEDDVVRKKRRSTPRSSTVAPEESPPSSLPPPPPRPARAALDAAEQAATDGQSRHDAEDRDWRKRHEELEKERRQLDVSHDKERARLADDEDRARHAYDKAMRKWEASI